MGYRRMCPEEREYRRLVAEKERKQCRVRRLGHESRIRSSVAYNQYLAKREANEKRKKRPRPGIPQWAQINLGRYPLLVKLGFAAVFIGTIALFFPFWCTVLENSKQIASFGLWSYCDSEVHYCVSVHDNIIPGKDVPVWYTMCQYNFAIGQFMSVVTIAILTSNVYKNEVLMSPTVHMAAECFSAIAALEKFISVYVFHTYIEKADFLYTWDTVLEYHASFYCACASLALDLITAFVLFLEEEIGPRPSTVRKAQNQPYLIPLSAQNDQEGVFHHPEASMDEPGYYHADLVRMAPSHENTPSSNPVFTNNVEATFVQTPGDLGQNNAAFDTTLDNTEEKPLFPLIPEEEEV